ncbi:beta strand repeat-containing protein [Reyranella soli]|uniref:VWFD domain-containing protein n=1 Tax=Reyranella soli TaxID=1230389 RepID=A0A512NHK6_9HYPH|nr:VWD domain-containing protein [Reyranella soli]GEP58434.1 hypothetical protein RSO01_56000 [Reyranella soli]
MSTSDDGKPLQTGLVDMGDISFYNNPSTAVPFSTLLNSDLDPYPGLFSEIVLNVTWAQLQPVTGIDTPLITADIDIAIALVAAYNQQHDTDLGIKLRVWGGFTAPEWAKNINGPPIAVIDKDGNPQTLGRFWSADYIDAWTSLQNALATAFDGNALIRGISNTAGASETDEPFIPLTNGVYPLQAVGYTDAAQQLTLRAAIADYSQWSTTPLDYTMNLFHLADGGHSNGDENFTLAVLQQARNSARVVQAGNHALNNPLPSSDAFIYLQMQADAALDPSATGGSLQTASPRTLLSSATTNSTENGAFDGPTPAFPGYAGWPYVIANGAAANAGDIELWDGLVPYPGFPGLTANQVQFLATVLAAGNAPTTGAPDDGSALGFIAPAFVTGAPGTVGFSGVDAVLLASATTQSAYSVTLTSTNGGTLGVTDPFGIAGGSTSGPTLSLSGPLSQINTVLASLTDMLQSGRDIVQIAVTDSSGNTAVRTVGVEISAPVAAPAASPPSDVNGTTISDITALLANKGVLFVGGVENAQTVNGDLQIGPDLSLLAALAPSAYSTASLAVSGALEVLNGGIGRFSGNLGGSTATIESGAQLSGNGTLSASGGGAIVNDGTIEAVTDLTLGLQRLTLANALAGSGTVTIDAGATLIANAAIGATQTINFASPPNLPFSPSTLELQAPFGMGGAITGFSYADRLILNDVTVNSASYDSGAGLLTVNLQTGGPLVYRLTGDLTGLSPTISGGHIITFAPLSPGIAPSVVVPQAASLQGAVDRDVLVPNIVLEMPIPDGTILPIAEITVTLTTTAGTGGRLLASDVTGNGTITITGNNTGTLTLAGSLFAVEQSLQTLTYKGRTTTPDSISISATNYAGIASATATISVSNYASGATPDRFEWDSSVAVGSFSDVTNWKLTGSGASTTTPPGGVNVALFKPGSAGAYTVSGDGAVDQVNVTAPTTLTGQVIAQGASGVGLVVDANGTLLLAGGGEFTDQAKAIVGGTGAGLLTLMGGALALTGSTADALVVGEAAGSDGTVVNLEQITANGTVVIGESGSGTLALLGVASSMTAGGATIGRSAGSQGTALVNGGFWAIGQSTTDVTSSGELVVGDAGNGSLLIDGAANGISGQVTAYEATIGRQAGSHGVVRLDGGLLLVANTNATGDTILTVGDDGDGSLAIEHGSEVAVGAASANNNGLLLVGRADDGRGRIRIGDYSALLVYGDAHLGEAGAAEVTVGAGADHDALFGVNGTLTLGAAGHLALGGTDATVRAEIFHIASGGGVSGWGTLSGLGGGSKTVQLADIHNDGSIKANGGELLLYGGVTGSGDLSMAAGSSLTLQAAVGTEQTLTFGANGHALLNDPHAFRGTIVGFNGDDVLELASTHASSATWANGVLTLDTDLGPLRLKIAGDYAADGFTVTPDGLGGTNVAGGRGDVHMMTFDGLHYDFQAVGEFVAVQWTDPATPLQIRIETAGVHGVASITTELEAVFGNTKVTFAVGQAISLHVDGAPDIALHGGGVQAIPGGTLAQLSSGTYQLTWNTGQAVIVSYHGNDWLDWGVALGPHDGAGSVRGLLGSHSGQGTDFQLPDGTILHQPLSNEDIVGFYADAWRVSPDGSPVGDSHHPPVTHLTHHDAIL